MTAVVRLLVSALFALLLAVQGLAQSHSAFPIDVTAGPPPQPFNAGGKTRLSYELHFTNFSAGAIEILRLDLLGGEGSAPLASYDKDQLEKLLVLVGSDGNGNPNKVGTIGGGRSVIIFLDLALEPDRPTPTALHHRLLLSIPRKKDGTGGTIENTINGPAVGVVQEQAPVLRAPLRGSGWVAFNSFGSEDHRRALVPVDGNVRIAQRFAIDWMCLGPDGNLFHGDSKSNANFYGYGAEVLAVADGRISDFKDGIPENAGSNEPSTRNITLDNLVGNYLILDLGPGNRGNGRFALYAHLQPGSLRVKLGDRVKTGQALARLGNTGNSDAPHLHFHLMDANSPVGAEGIPYELETFTQLGTVDDPQGLDSGKTWKPKTGETPIVHGHQFPLDNAVVTFP